MYNILVISIIICASIGMHLIDRDTLSASAAESGRD